MPSRAAVVAHDIAVIRQLAEETSVLVRGERGDNGLQSRMKEQERITMTGQNPDLQGRVDRIETRLVAGVAAITLFITVVGFIVGIAVRGGAG